MTVAALAMVGAGVVAAVLARRRATGAVSDKQPPPGRPSSKLMRKTLKQLDTAIALLEGRGSEPPAQTVHEARKALKRARALVRLQREALGGKRFRRTNAALRDAARALAGARDAEVIVEALDLLIERHPGPLAGSPATAAVRAAAVAERERSRMDTRQGAPARAAIVVQLQETRRALELWEPSLRGDASRRDARDERKTTRSGLERIYREGRRRGRGARRADTSEALHQWRKRVKDLRYVAEALKLPGVAHQADRLGETIGEEHDLALLREHVRRNRRCFRGEQATRRALQKLIRARRRRLRRRAWRLGERLYSRKPRRFVRRTLGA
jgi:CHAD domain-containing protein